MELQVCPHCDSKVRGDRLGKHVARVHFAELPVAAAKGDVTAVQSFLTAGADPQATYAFRWTALHEAAAAGQREVAELLITHGADVHAKNVQGLTPLHHAAARGQFAVAELLILNGASPNACQGPTLRGVWDYRTPLHEAAAKGHVDMVRLLLSHDADPNATASDLRATPLSYAVSFAETERLSELVQILLKNGASPNAGDCPPLRDAVWRRNKDVAKLLLAHGADPQRPDHHGKTPKQYAESGGAEFIELFY